MGKIVTNRDYHLAKFRVAKYLEKGVDILSEAEETDLNEVIVEMQNYEAANVQPAARTSLTSLLNEYLETRNKLF